MAGLSAAAHLEKNNYDYTILEASDRVGGRIKTIFQEQGNINLTIVTRQEFENIKNQSKTPVILRNKMEKKQITITLIGKLKHSRTQQSISLAEGKSVQIPLLQGLYRVLVKYDYQDTKKKSEFA